MRVRVRAYTYVYRYIGPTVNIMYSLWYTLILISNFIAFLVNDYYSCLGCPRHKPFGFQEDLHGHNYVLIVLS